ncbi:hypothetical protein AHAS_Ahas02G0177400 [Arachis hypogaea]
MSEISLTRIALFEDSVDAWIHIACPRLLIYWGDTFGKPVLNPFEAEIVLGVIPGWWEKKKNVLVAKVQEGYEDGGVSCQKSGDSSCECSCGEDENGNGKSNFHGEYPMDYYSQDGGEWNSSYVKKSFRPVRRISVSSVATSAISQQYFLAEIEGPEQKYDSEAENGLQMLLDSNPPALEMDFLKLQQSI